MQTQILSSILAFLGGIFLFFLIMSCYLVPTPCLSLQIQAVEHGLFFGGLGGVIGAVIGPIKGKVGYIICVIVGVLTLILTQIGLYLLNYGYCEISIYPSLLVLVGGVIGLYYSRKNRGESNS